MATYTVKVDSCEARPKVVTEFNEVPDNQLEQVVYVAKRTFRSVEVTDEETGEVVLTYYVGERLYEKAFGYGEAIDIICNYAYEK